MSISMRRLQARKNAQSALNNNVVWYNTLEDVTNMLETEDGKKLNKKPQNGAFFLLDAA